MSLGIGKQNFALRGEEAPGAKLTEHDVRLIRQIHKEGQEGIARLRATCSSKALAEKFGVHPNTITKIICGKNWRHVKP